MRGGHVCGTPASALTDTGWLQLSVLLHDSARRAAPNSEAAPAREFPGGVWPNQPVGNASIFA